MSSPRILLFDRASSVADRLLDALQRAGFDARTTSIPEQAAELLRSERIDVLLGEIGAAAEALVEQCGTGEAAPTLVLFEDFASSGGDSEALRRRAFETLARPVAEEEVLRVVQRAIEHRTLLQENRRLRGALGERFELGSLVTKDARMRRIFDRVETIAESKASILLTGESGTGKTVLARAIHERSPRSTGPFIAVNCGALPAQLLEDELFGHVKGAFTGAVRDREGKFAAADGGTLFLDEIGTASQELQVKLLRMLEEGLFERIGENQTRSADVRLLAATNADLEEEVSAGRFRADLYYRIQVVGIELPPLRSRPADISILAELFLDRFAREHQRDIRALTPEAMRWLVTQAWPGNIRELENVLERAVLLAKGSELSLDDLAGFDAFGPAQPLGTDPSVPEAPQAAPRLETLPMGPLREMLAIPERWMLVRALREHHGCRQGTAHTLGINRSTLFNKMRKYDLLSFPIGAAAPQSGEGDRDSTPPAA